jgi:hypothetical protein
MTHVHLESLNPWPQLLGGGLSSRLILIEQYNWRDGLCHTELDGATDTATGAGHNTRPILQSKPIGIL